MQNGKTIQFERWCAIMWRCGYYYILTSKAYFNWIESLSIYMQFPIIFCVFISAKIKKNTFRPGECWFYECNDFFSFIEWIFDYFYFLFLFTDLQFPIDLSNVAKDHPFLENDPLQSLYRRLVALNRCATMRLDSAHKHTTNVSELFLFLLVHLTLRREIFL